MQQEELYPIYEKGVGELIEDRRKIKEKKKDLSFQVTPHSEKTCAKMGICPDPETFLFMVL